MTENQTQQGKRKIEAALPIKTVRGLLLLRGASLKAWSDAHGYSDGAVHHAIRGKRRGPKARQIVRELRDELGL